MDFPRTIEGLTKRTSGFDFLVGDWSVDNERLTDPLSNGPEVWYSTPATARSITLHNGAISVDEMWYPELNFAGSSVRVFVNATDTWRVHWVNSDSGNLQPAVEGKWDDGIFLAFGDDEFEGRPILARYMWHSITEQSAVWEQAFSVDAGDTWETNWIMRWTRHA